MRVWKSVDLSSFRRGKGLLTNFVMKHQQKEVGKFSPFMSLGKVEAEMLSYLAALNTISNLIFVFANGQTGGSGDCT